MVAREGIGPAIVLATGAGCVAYFVGALASAPLWLATLAVIWLFRDLPRQTPADPNGVVSPVDGSIEAVTSCRDRWLDREAVAIAIRMTLPGISVLRSPVEGKIRDFWTSASPAERRGHWSRWMNPYSRYAIWISTDEGDDVVLEVSSSRLFSRLRFAAAVGERIGQGQRNGFVYFATRLRILIPDRSKNVAPVGLDVQGGSAIVATLIHPQKR